MLMPHKREHSPCIASNTLPTLMLCKECWLRAVQEQCKVMTDKHHIYMTSDGRISLAGLPSSKAEYLAKAIDDCVRNH